ncbi:hypothetical protein NHX12_028681 [Muraenolepis orangiensis]|uniref:Uncharacterized protein n=1 Tax=Muraenolepis orangiensis TaxID=630683 RepID=A0A9Q0IMR5_9TELE|nr:hypothetical protein NHX12_028681 [Muraenolepis orangiensis]
MSRVGAAPPPPLQREALQRWLSGAGGVAVPGLGVALPYLPPFVSSLDTLHALLSVKEGLEETAFQLLTDPRPGSRPRVLPGLLRGDIPPLRSKRQRGCGATTGGQALCRQPRLPDAEGPLPVLLHASRPPGHLQANQRKITITRQATGNATLLQDGKGAKSFPALPHRPLETQDPSGQDTSEETSEDTGQDDYSKDNRTNE